MVCKRYEVDDLMYVSFVVLDEAWTLNFARASGYRVCLNAGLEVCEAMSSKIAFEWVVFVGGAFLAPSCFLSFHVVLCFKSYSSWTKIRL